MRLIKCTIQNFKRFKNTSVSLDRKLLAFVGPNEAGKSSLFEALMEMDSYDPIPVSMLRRGVEHDEDDIIISMQYLIEKEDLLALKALSGEGEPRFFGRKKSVKGSITRSFSDPILRDKSFRKNCKKEFKRRIAQGNLKSVFREYYIETIEEEDETVSTLLYDYIESLLEELEVDIETLSEETLDKLNTLNLKLKEIIPDLKGQKETTITDLQQLLSKAIYIEESKHPETTFKDYLTQKRSKFILFDDANRFLKGTYDTATLIEGISPAFSNLLDVAELDAVNLHQLIQSEDHGKFESVLEEGNEKLKEKYLRFWNQSKTFPKLKYEGEIFRVLIRFVDTYNSVGDRSDGLKQFLSLLAFISSSNFKNPPILLVDEAELHLHYSAQADIVELFETQKLADSIFYTTHSAGCLPSDLGTGIRVVQPLYDEDKVDTGISELKNSIWSNTGGFSPLLFAMGANIIAFTPTRHAVITEGPTETILLSRILREACELDNLGFQVAPGIAEVSPAKAAQFELEAAKVCYLVDGDEGGEDNARQLISAGISKKKIIPLPKHMSLEDLISREVLLDAINEELRRSGKPLLTIEVKDIPLKNSFNFIKEVAKKKKVKLPYKGKIAEIIAMTPSDKLIINLKNRATAKSIFNKLSNVLKTAL